MREIAVDGRDEDDLELLLGGALSPLDGFGAPESGVTLAIPSGIATRVGPGDTVRLLDVEGAPLAEMAVLATHAREDGALGVVGPVRALSPRTERPFEYLYQPAAMVRPAPGQWLVVPVEDPLTDRDLDDIAAAATGRRIVLLALVGAGRPRGVSPVGLIRASLVAAEILPDADVVAVPLARREDVALDRQIRDRVIDAYTPDAGPGRRARIVHPTHQGPLPPAVEAVVRSDRPTGSDQGVVVLFTGLSGSGKSTIARGVRNALLEAGDRTVTLLDGDVVRRHLSAGLGFSREDRDANVRRIGWVAAEIGRHGGLAIASPIAPFAATRSAVRDMAEATGAAFLLVHVATPLAECERRDRKGLYARARAGEIPDFTGISSPYEEPMDSDLRIDTTEVGVADAVAAVLTLLRRRGLVR